MKKVAIWGVLLLSSAYGMSAGAVMVSHSYRFGSDVSKEILSKIDVDASRFRNHVAGVNQGGDIASHDSTWKFEVDTTGKSKTAWRIASDEAGDLGAIQLEKSLDKVLGTPSLRDHVETLLDGQKDEGGIGPVEQVTQQQPQSPSHCKTKYVAPVPEPEIYAMMVAGAGMIGAVSRRRRKTAS